MTMNEPEIKAKKKKNEKLSHENMNRRIKKLRRRREEDLENLLKFNQFCVNNATAEITNNKSIIYIN